MRFSCLIMVGAFLLFIAIAESRGDVGHSTSNPKRELIDVGMNSKNIESKAKGIFRQPELLHFGRDARIKIFNRAFLRTKRTRTPGITVAAPRFTKHRYEKLRGPSKNSKRRVQHVQRSLGVDKDSNSHSLSNVSEYIGNFKNSLHHSAIYLEPVFHHESKEDWLKGWTFDTEDHSPNRLGPLIGPVHFPSLGPHVYIRQVDPLQEESSHVVLHFVTKEPKLAPVVIQVGASISKDVDEILPDPSVLHSLPYEKHEKHIVTQSAPFTPPVHSLPPVDLPLMLNEVGVAQRAPDKPILPSVQPAFQQPIYPPRINHPLHGYNHQQSFKSQEIQPEISPPVQPFHENNNYAAALPIVPPSVLFQTKPDHPVNTDAQHTVVNNLYHRNIQQPIHPTFTAADSHHMVAQQLHKHAGTYAPMSVAMLQLQAVDKLPELPHRNIQQPIHPTFIAADSHHMVAQQLHKHAGTNAPMSVAMIPLQALEKLPELPLYPPINDGPQKIITHNFQQNNIENGLKIDRVAQNIRQVAFSNLHDVQRENVQPNFVEVTAPNLKRYFDGSSEEFGSHTIGLEDYDWKEDDTSAINSDSHVSNTNHYENIVKTSKPSKLVSKNNGIALSALIGNATVTSTKNTSKGIVIVTPGYPWYHKSTTMSAEVKPVFEITDDYEDFAGSKSLAYDSKSLVIIENNESYKNITKSSTPISPTSVQGGPGEFESKKLNKTTVIKT